VTTFQHVQEDKLLCTEFADKLEWQSADYILHVVTMNIVAVFQLVLVSVNNHSYRYISTDTVKERNRSRQD